MHVVLFDIDGTLLSSGGAGQEAMEAAFLAEFGPLGPVDGITTAGRTDRAITHDLFRFHGVDLDEPRFERFKNAYLDQLPRTLATKTGLLLPGIEAVLEGLARRDDVELALLTGNFERGAWIKLRHYNIHRYFADGGFGDHHHDRDDVARTAVETVERRLGRAVSRSRTWVIGDTPADVKCGRAIGAQVVAVGTGHYDRATLEATSPDHLFDDFSRPESLLALFDGAATK